MKVVSSRALLRVVTRPVEDLRESWFSAGTVVRGSDVLVQGYYRDHNDRNNCQIKFAGGSRKVNGGPEPGHRFDRTPVDTILAEFGEEVFPCDEGRIVSFRPFYLECLPNHDRFFFLLGIEGGMREGELIEAELNRFGRYEMLAPPVLMPISTLVVPGVFFPGQLKALKALCHHLAGAKEDFGYAYRELEHRGV